MVTRRTIERLVAAVDVAAALFLAVMTLLTFADVLMRYILLGNVPDGFDLGRLLLCVALFWGVAGCCHRGEHIQVDFVWELLPPAGRRLLDLVAVTVTAIFMIGLSWMTLVRVQSTLDSGQTTSDLQLPLWPFYAIAWLGVALGTLLLAGRYAAVLRGGEKQADE